MECEKGERMRMGEVKLSVDMQPVVQEPWIIREGRGKQLKKQRGRYRRRDYKILQLFDCNIPECWNGGERPVQCRDLEAKRCRVEKIVTSID